MSALHECNVPMAQAPREVARRLEPVQIQVERDDASTRIGKFRKMGRLATRRGGAIDHHSARRRRQHLRHQLRGLGLRMK